MSWKFAWNHECLQNAIVLVNWTWITVLERKTPNSPKIYAKHKIGSTNIRFAWFWATFVFWCFLAWKSAFCYEKGAWCHENLLEILKVSKMLLLIPIQQKYTRNTKLVLPTSVLHNFVQLLFLVWKSALWEHTGKTLGAHRENTWSTQGAHRENTGSTQGAHRENTGKTQGAHRKNRRGGVTQRQLVYRYLKILKGVCKRAHNCLTCVST